MAQLVKYYAAPGARPPEKKSKGAAAFDVCAHLPPDTNLKIAPGQRFPVPTGLHFAIPEGFFLSVRPRSGLALNHGITCLNTPGTIDSDYRGELKIILVNHSNQDFVIENGDRVAQILLEEEVIADWEPARSPEELGITDRGAGGFGSTGLA
ncbi:MAG: dUTP diphosphatase [Spirochaetaceae bacterium]|mgnify:CR=1 FL=1|nr:dUTP diphosphatase [Spirochaetaceae bacterium]|tara:strand:- start:31268 stop:31723 length:456 start_codon:yes stop_codon:yes gene_type:complete